MRQASTHTVKPAAGKKKKDQLAQALKANLKRRREAGKKVRQPQ